jgi:predicted nucleotidyltransferase component of viral defense system
VRTSTQLKARIRNLARDRRVGAEIVLREFMLERLLERIHASSHRESIILKGGMLVGAMVGIDTRATMDMDTTITGRQMDADSIAGMFTEIARTQLDDGVIFSLHGIEEIRDEADYPGYRVKLDARLDRTRQTLHVDVTTGDVLTPGAIEYGFPLMFDKRTINILAYNVETVLAEKYETVITRGTANTRMKDFYDIHVLTDTRDIDTPTLRTAVSRTAANRGTVAILENAREVIERLSTDRIMTQRWQRYRNHNSYAANLDWTSAMTALTTLNRSIQI